MRGCARRNGSTKGARMCDNRKSGEITFNEQAPEDAGLVALQGIVSVLVDGTSTAAQVRAEADAEIARIHAEADMREDEFRTRVWSKVSNWIIAPWSIGLLILVGWLAYKL